MVELALEWLHEGRVNRALASAGLFRDTIPGYWGPWSVGHLQRSASTTDDTCWGPIL
jgi:hypothetical protein